MPSPNPRRGGPSTGIEGHPRRGGAQRLVALLGIATGGMLAAGIGWPRRNDVHRSRAGGARHASRDETMKRPDTPEGTAGQVDAPPLGVFVEATVWCETARTEAPSLRSRSRCRPLSPWFGRGPMRALLPLLLALLELGAGAAALPETFGERSGAVGPVAGVGARLGPLRLGGRVLWAPPALNGASLGGTVVTGAVTLGLAR